MYRAPVSMNIFGLLFRVHCNHGIIVMKLKEIIQIKIQMVIR